MAAPPLRPEPPPASDPSGAAEALPKASAKRFRSLPMVDDEVGVAVAGDMVVAAALMKSSKSDSLEPSADLSPPGADETRLSPPSMQSRSK